jgi:hypothetical protein
MEEGKGGQKEAMHPAALHHEHSKAHHIGKAFASAHGRSHEGGLGGATAGSACTDAVNPSEVGGAGEMGQFE